MIKKNLTILVVGAGANADFVFKDEDKRKKEKISMPTGEQLVEKIADWEGQVLPNLYWGFIAKNVEKYCEDRLLIEGIASLVASSQSLYQPMISQYQLNSKITSLKPDFECNLFFEDLVGKNYYIDPHRINNTIAAKIKVDDKFCWYHKISEIVKHYQPFSIDEMLDSINIGKVDVSKWIGKTENDQDEKEKLIQAGKDLIALFLLQSEDKKVFDYEASCWYRHLRNAIITCGSNKEEIKNKLKNFVIISFNYDRSLDYFLRTRVGEFYQDIKIEYPYGSLAKDETWSGGDYKEIPYGAAKNEKSFQKKWENFQKAKELAKNLKVIGEMKEEAEEIKEVMSKSTKLFFLGFAFHLANCEIMGIKELDVVVKWGELLGEASEKLRFFPESKEEVFYTNFKDSEKIRSSFDSIFNQDQNKSLVRKSSSKGTYDALLQDFDLRL